ncbi:MAG: hypothetical protein VW127_00575 [Flavobacteriaceae bacterium]|jgi:hypothetical protein
MKKQKILLATVLLLSGIGLKAQQGIGTVTPNDNAALEIQSPDKGLLIPRISLTNSSTLFLGVIATSEHNGMLVYNTNTTVSKTTGLLGEGIYQWRLPATGGVTYHWFKMLTSEDDDFVTGTVTHSTLSWDGENWVENDQLLSSSNQISITTDLFVDSGATTLTLNNSGLDLITVGTITVSATSLTVTGTTTFTDTITLDRKLIDGYGNAGNEGYLLSATATATRWVDFNAQTLEIITTSTTPSATTKILLVRPSSENITVTLNPSGTNDNEYPEGFALKIRRDSPYSATNTYTLNITPDSSETINGQNSIKMNLGYQSVTLYKTQDGWVSID